MKNERLTDPPSNRGSPSSNGGDLLRLLERARQFLESRAQRPATSESPRSCDDLAASLRAALRDDSQARLDRGAPA